GREGGGDAKPREIQTLLTLLENKGGDLQNGVGLAIIHPYDETVFPPEIAAPVFTWEDKIDASERWLITVELRNRPDPIYAMVRERTWTPPRGTWEIMKSHSVLKPARVTITGFSNGGGAAAVSKNSIRFSTSRDRVDAPVFYRQVMLPFEPGKSYLKKTRWLLGDISSYEKPAVVMENRPVCAGCHVFSRDGAKISMEMNRNGDSGAQFVTRVREKIALTGEDFITWSDFPRPDILPKTRGLFARMSPGGKYIVSTVNEISFMALTNDPAFSQLFFPTYGALAWASIKENTLHTLPGADNRKFIQTAPAWSPDEKYILFSRSETRNEHHEDVLDVHARVENADIHELNKKFPIQFDIYRIPFNNGAGGAPELLRGAGANGMSNYFPRCSPDNKWIVFTRSKSGIMLQPDSNLYIVPAGGGAARKMRCNRSRMNSWHSWSPNGKWLLFSSKAHTMYTEIFLTHVDENGNDEPPVRLTRFSDSRRAANTPEFANIDPGGIVEITD
ncbi:MAG: hypothetical protein GY859_32060, partial [Desulfobacterales bacterium]|nr:hypothetical protein [Desulfobacterales bacterium]